jgi:hypothetical protein
MHIPNIRRKIAREDRAPERRPVPPGRNYPAEGSGFGTLGVVISEELIESLTAGRV